MKKTVYLDQNHWIGLARAFYGTDDRFKDALDRAQQAKKDERALFPISLVHCMEVHKIEDERRRRQLAEFMVDLSGGWFLAPWASVLEVETLNATAEFYSMHCDPDPVEALGRGLVFAFGAEHWSTERAEVTPEALKTFSSISDQRWVLLSFMVGDAAPGIGHLRSLTAELNKSYAAANRRNQIDKHSMSDSDMRAHRTHEIYQSILEHVIKAHQIFSRNPKELLRGSVEEVRDRIEGYLSLMPSAYVDLELGLQRDRQWSKPVQGNDLADLAHLNVAIPYCDIVITEKFWTDLAQRSGLGTRFSTEISASVNSLRTVFD